MEDRARIREILLKRGAIRDLESTFASRAASADRRSSRQGLEFNVRAMVLATVTDITERKHFEQRLAAQYAVHVCSRFQYARRIHPQSYTRRRDSYGRSTLWQVDGGCRVIRCVEIWHAPASRPQSFRPISRTSPSAGRRACRVACG